MSHVQTPGFVDMLALQGLPLACLKHSESIRLTQKSVTVSWHHEQPADLLSRASTSSRDGTGFQICHWLSFISPHKTSWETSTGHQLSVHRRPAWKS